MSETLGGFYADQKVGHLSGTDLAAIKNHFSKTTLVLRKEVYELCNMLEPDVLQLYGMNLKEVEAEKLHEEVGTMESDIFELDP